MMATTEERMKILKMIQEGKISAEDGAKLLAALRDSQAKTGRVHAVGAPRTPGWLRVRVTDMTSGRTKVNVNLPLSLMESGLLIGAKYAPELGGIDVDQLVTDIRSGASGKIIDVIDEEDGEHVEIFIE
jgi:hypothetical protein